MAIGIGDRVLMMENAVYSVITPEGCAAILWKDATEAHRAAECLRLTASDLQKFELIDEIISEKNEWVYSESDRDHDLDLTTKKLKEKLIKVLGELTKMDDDERLSLRYKKFRRMGNWLDRQTS